MHEATDLLVVRASFQETDDAGGIGEVCKQLLDEHPDKVVKYYTSDERGWVITLEDK